VVSKRHLRRSWRGVELVCHFELLQHINFEKRVVLSRYFGSSKRVGVDLSFNSSQASAMADEIGVLKTAPSSPALFGANGLKRLNLAAAQPGSQPSSPSKPSQPAHTPAAKPVINSLTIVGVIDGADGVTNYLVRCFQRRDLSQPLLYLVLYQ